ncbi:bleomycin hydrolase-like [Planococcus citri]|uniref:bleomycin hydrolase-like n=1 Tax=Planococcus citri TaxID=170843 RepID=UPI0031FA36C4
MDSSKDTSDQVAPKPSSQVDTPKEDNTISDTLSMGNIKDDPAQSTPKPSSEPDPYEVIFKNCLNQMKFAFDEYNDPIDILAQNACTRSEPLKERISNSRVQDPIPQVSFKIEAETKPGTSQKSTGRCWIFDGLNVIRKPFNKKYELEDFKFSQPFISFWDKMERSYFFFKLVVHTARKNEPVDGRLESYLRSTPIKEGEQWNVLLNLITRYGLMPEENFPTSDDPVHSDELNSRLTIKVCEFANFLRTMVKDGKSDADLERAIDGKMFNIFGTIAIWMGGIPDLIFTWKYLDKFKQYQSKGPITPLDFYKKYVEPVFNVDDQRICLETEYCLGNVVEPVQSLAKLCDESLKIKEPCTQLVEYVEECHDLILEDEEREKEGVARKEDCYFRNNQPLEYENDYDYLIFEDEKSEKEELARRRELGAEQFMKRLALEYAEMMASGGSTEEFLKKAGIR